MTSKHVELLAPGGDIEAIKAAIVAGADAIYCGLDSFNARNRATNISIEELHGALRLAHTRNCKIFLTLNIVILQSELKSLFKLLNQLVNTSLDGVIVQDLGLLYILKTYFPSLDVHASTQLTTHNGGQIAFLSQLGVSRVNLCRELNLFEIKALNQIAHESNVKSEVFVHGSMCIGFSGLCYATSVTEGNSGNRGRCSQACRNEYQPTEMGNKFPLNLKDNSAFYELNELLDAGVDSLKIEGRIKGEHYVYTTVDCWRKHLDNAITHSELLLNDDQLHKVFNRNFSNGFLKGNIGQSMFIDNPRDHSFKAAVIKGNATTKEEIDTVKAKLIYDKDILGADLRAKTAKLDIAIPNITIKFEGEINKHFIVSIEGESILFSVSSNMLLTKSATDGLTEDHLVKRFKSFDNFDYHVVAYDFTDFVNNLSLPFKELAQIKNQLAFLLNDSVGIHSKVELPNLQHHSKENHVPQLVVLIDKAQDIDDLYDLNISLYFKLPESFTVNDDKWIALFTRYSKLKPWFPAILIGKDFQEAIRLVTKVKPETIITNNTGIANYAAEQSINWVAGPYLNTTNSYAMLAMQQHFNASGAFISNELNRLQIKNIAGSPNFKLFYSIYHPILLMSSRQCFFQQTSGCKKKEMTKGCLPRCEKITEIVNMKGMSFTINKNKGEYPSLYHNEAFLNLDIIEDLPNMFDGLLVDLSQVNKQHNDINKHEVVGLFQRYIAGDKDVKQKLTTILSKVTHNQYVKGL